MAQIVSGLDDLFSTAKLNINTATTTQIVAGVAGQQIKVFRLVLTASAAQTIDIKDGTTSLTSPMTLGVGVPLVLDLDGNPWFTTSAGAALNITTTTTGQVSGIIYYLQKSPNYG